jgi:hypothetical protein
MRPMLPAILICILALTSREARAQASTQAGRDRAAAAAQHQAALRDEGCSGCKVWVSGVDNTSLYILDPEARTTPNDYNGYPVAWCNNGFRRVTYYSAQGVVYAAHSCN